MDTQQVAAAVCELLPEVAPHSLVVGRWVWVSTPTKPDVQTRDTLKYLGFRWNPKRVAWQHSCGFSCKHAPYDPRDKYVSTPLTARV